MFVNLPVCKITNLFVNIHFLFNLESNLLSFIRHRRPYREIHPKCLWWGIGRGAQLRW